MARARIEEVDFNQFQAALQRAADTGERLEMRDRSAWTHWVKEQGIKEAAFRSVGATQYRDLGAVIIKSGQWQGYYLCSEQEEACLKWVEPTGSSKQTADKVDEE